jgi:hypothetical protein
MASREFHGVISNEWDSPLVWSTDEVDGGEWQDPWYPSRGAGRIEPNTTAEWRSESDGIMTGTSGWARWGVRVLDVSEGDRFEFVQVNWSVPYYQTSYPNITCAVFRNNPNQTDAFAQPDPRPPLLEIVPAVQHSDGVIRAMGSGGAPGDFGELAPYVHAVPWSWFLHPLFTGAVTHPRVHFIVRRRGGSQARSPLTFPDMFPSRQQMAMQGFRHRTELASSASFLGGFPNFHESIQGRRHFGGAVFVKHAAAEWRDVPLVELGTVAVEDFAGRLRATNTWARQHGFIGGFPTFFHADYGSGVVCGTLLIKSDGAELRDIPLAALGNPALDDFEARFRATQDYATRNGFVGGFPTLHHDRAVVHRDPRTGQRQYATVCGTVLFHQGEIDIHTMRRRTPFAAHRNVFLSQDPA